MPDNFNIINQPQGQTFPPAKKSMGVKAVWVVVLVVIIVGFVLWITLGKKGKSNPKPVVSSSLPTGYSVQPVPSGQFPQQMPKEILAPFPDAKALSGEVITQPNMPTHVVTRFIVSAPTEQVYYAYLLSFQWTDVTGKVLGLNTGEIYTHFSKAKEDLETYFTPHASSTIIQLNYSFSN